MTNQQQLFQLPADITYLNCAYMSPLLKSVEAAGIEAMQRKRNPTAITADDFFTDGEKLKAMAGQLINAPAEQMAIIPSASYGLATAVNNLPLDNGSKAVTVAHEFPSGYLTLQSWCNRHGKTLQVVEASPVISEGRGQQWNEDLLNSISDDTAVVLLSSVHWTDGTRFDLPAIGAKCQRHGAVFIVDGTQSVGAIPIDVQACGIDALVCAGYKWLMGPYAIGFAYFAPRFNNGRPLEESWVNRANAADFTSLTQYNDDYTAGAGRYNMGEYGNFILLPMFKAALEQILVWGVDNIESYCGELTVPLAAFLQQNGFGVEGDAYRSKHLLGVGLPPHIALPPLTALLRQHHIYVSVRGQSLRISAHLYNSAQDMEKLMEVLRQAATG
jgi:selenocysteine lyase/cysteine desulfurase